MRVRKVFGLRQRVGFIFFGSLMVLVAITSTSTCLIGEFRLIGLGLVGAVLVVGSLLTKADVYVWEDDSPPHNSGGSQ